MYNLFAKKKQNSFVRPKRKKNGLTKLKVKHIDSKPFSNMSKKDVKIFGIQLVSHITKVSICI